MTMSQQDTEARAERLKAAQKIGEAVEEWGRRDPIPPDAQKLDTSRLKAAQREQFVGLVADRRWMSDDATQITVYRLLTEGTT
jgi:hypothetical protein